MINTYYINKQTTEKKRKNKTKKGDGLRDLRRASEQLRHVRNVRGNVQVHVSGEDEEREVQLQLRHLEPWARPHGVRDEGIPVSGERRETLTHSFIHVTPS